MRRLLSATADSRASGAFEAAAELVPVAAAAATAVAAIVPEAGVLDVLAGVKFYLGQGGLP